MPRPLSRVSGWFALLWASLLVFWLACGLGIVTDVAISPIYFVLALYPFWAFFSLFCLWLILRSVARRLIAFAPPAFAARAAFESPIAFTGAIAGCALGFGLRYRG